MIDFLDMLPKISSIAQEAGKIIESFYHKDLLISIKADGSKVTQADRISEDFIMREINKLTPSIPIVSEEAVEMGKIPNITGGTFWLVDPLDGTDGFIQKNDDFVVNIGLIQNFYSVFGVVHAPISKLTYQGIAYMESSVTDQLGVTTKIRAKDPTDEKLKVLLYHFLPKNLKRDEYLDKLGPSENIMNSDALRFCRVAEGEVDVHVCFESCFEWDTAAGHAIVKGAGGNIVNSDNTELIYGKKKFRNKPFIAHGKLGYKYLPFLKS